MYLNNCPLQLKELASRNTVRVRDTHYYANEWAVIFPAIALPPSESRNNLFGLFIASFDWQVFFQINFHYKISEISKMCLPSGNRIQTSVTTTRPLDLFNLHSRIGDSQNIYIFYSDVIKKLRKKPHKNSGCDIILTGIAPHTAPSRICY